jgi:sirohydrochlorin cobaltochelatase
MAERAIVLFAHGARDARWARTLSELRTLVQARAPAAHIAIAFLEFQPPTLAEAIDDALANGARTIDVVPVFWASGGHVASDVVPMLDGLRVRHPGLALRVRPVLSELPGLLEFIADAVARPER